MSKITSPLDVVANAELKALTYMVMDSVGEGTVVEIEQHTVDKYGLEDMVDPTNSTIGAYAVTFARHGFAALQMKPSKHNARIVRYFAPSQREEVIPAIGATLGWAKEHRVPLRWFLSATASRSSSRAPTNSIALLRAALEGKAISDMPSDMYSSGDPNNTRLKTLIEQGVVVKEDTACCFTINEPVYRGRRIPFENLRFETQHLYTSMQAAKELFPDRDWTFDEFFDFTCRLLPDNQDTDQLLLNRLRRQAVMAVSIHTPRAYAGTINKIDLGQSNIRIADRYHEAVAELIERTDQLASSPGSRALFKDEAYDIYDDIAAAKSLILNDIDTSPTRGVDKRPQQ